MKELCKLKSKSGITHQILLSKYERSQVQKNHKTTLEFSDEFYKETIEDCLGRLAKKEAIYLSTAVSKAIQHSLVVMEKREI